MISAHGAEPLSVETLAALNVFLRNTEKPSETQTTVADPNQLLIFRVRKVREAWERGLNQLGTLGSGNHFLEVQKVDKSLTSR